MTRKQTTTRFRIIERDGSVYMTSQPVSEGVVVPRRRELRGIADGLKDVGAKLQESHDDGPWCDSPVEAP